MHEPFTLNPAGTAACVRTRAEFRALAEQTALDLPPSRERSIMLTKLEEACMWAVRGIASLPHNHDK